VRAGALTKWTQRLLALDDLEPGTRVIVGCSGGADSLALLALTCDAGFDVVAVYVDHGLRPETAHEAVVVARAAERFGAQSRVIAVDVDGGSNLEARARDVRLRALERERRATDAAAIFLGHTRDDQAETVLLNLLRGSGLAGLAGMAPRRGTVRRPLLRMRRAETQQICALLQFAPVHDPMNDDEQYRRVWLRREVIPRLERGARRDLVDVLARQAEVLRDDDELLDALAADHDPEDAVALAALPTPLARRVVRNWLGSPPPSLAMVDRVLDVATGASRAADLSGGRRVERLRGRLQLVPVAAPNHDDPASAPVRLSLPGRAAFADLEIEAWIDHSPPAIWPDGRSVAVCDAARVDPSGVIVRAAEAGERFRPLGSSGSKLVRDALAEAGVPAGRRSEAAVVAAQDVLWVVGYRIDDRVRVSERTQQFLWLSAGPAPV
jgi:tRNA(Ile)-lysidine synthase